MRALIGLLCLVLIPYTSSGAHAGAPSPRSRPPTDGLAALTDPGMDPAAFCGELCEERARQGEPLDMYLRGRHALEGQPDARSRSRDALRWFSRAAEAGLAEAQYAYGWMLLHRARATWSNRQEALRWMRRAARQGHEQARSFLAAPQYHRLGSPVFYPEWPRGASSASVRRRGEPRHDAP